MKRLHIIIMISAVMLAFSGCTQINEAVPVENTNITEEKSPYPTTIGSLVFNSEPETIASLSPAMTEIVSELGFEDKIIGRSIYCTYPSSIENTATIGSAANPDVNAIIEKTPQLLISQSPIAKKDITAIEAAGTRVLIMSAPSSVDDLYTLYSNIYRIFSGEAPNEAVKLEEIFEPLKHTFAENQNIMSSYAYILSPELAVASDSTFSGSFFSHFGTNAAGNIDNNTITTEELIELDPEYIILSNSMTEEDLPTELSEMSAVKDGKVIILDSQTTELLERPTSRLFIAAESLCNQIKSIQLDE